MARPLAPSVVRPLSVKITSRPPVYSHSRSAHFAFKAVSATSVACRLDGHAYAPCKSGHTYRSLHAGRHTFRVRVKRNGKIRVAMARWTVDLTRPTVPAVSGGSSSSGDRQRRPLRRPARPTSAAASPATRPDLQERRPVDGSRRRLERPRSRPPGRTRSSSAPVTGPATYRPGRRRQQRWSTTPLPARPPSAAPAPAGSRSTRRSSRPPAPAMPSPASPTTSSEPRPTPAPAGRRGLPRPTCPSPTRARRWCSSRPSTGSATSAPSRRPRSRSTAAPPACRP